MDQQSSSQGSYTSNGQGYNGYYDNTAYQQYGESQAQSAAEQQSYYSNQQQYQNAADQASYYTG